MVRTSPSASARPWPTALWAISARYSLLSRWGVHPMAARSPRC